MVLGNFVIIQARQISEDEAEVTILDLRTLGINIQGSRNGMQIGTNGFSHNTFKGVAGMIDIG